MISSTFSHLLLDMLGFDTTGDEENNRVAFLFSFDGFIDGYRYKACGDERFLHIIRRKTTSMSNEIRRVFRKKAVNIDIIVVVDFF